MCNEKNRQIVCFDRKLKPRQLSYLVFVHKVESFWNISPNGAISNSLVRVAERSRSKAQGYESVCYESPERAQAEHYNLFS